MSRRLTPKPPLTVWIVLGLLLFGFIVFYPAIKQLPLRQLLSEIDLRALLPRSEPEPRVWVNISSGTYYCAGSQGYRTLKPGEYMTEIHARHRGFRPALNRPCTEKSSDQHIQPFDVSLDASAGVF
jgi:hypothetical protein